MGWFNRKRGLQLAALVLAIGGGALALSVEIFAITAQQGAGQTTVKATAYEAAGPSVLLVLAIPIVLSLLPLFPRERPWVWLSYISAVGIVIFTITGIMSIGLLFLPAAILAVIGAFVQPPALS